MRPACLTLFLALALSAIGCQRIAESMVQAGIDEMFENWDERGGTYTPSPGDFTEPEPSSLAFLTGSESDNVVCFVPAAGTWDPVATYEAGERPIGIASAGGAGLLVTTRMGVRKGGTMFVARIELEEAVGAAELGLIAAGAGGDEVVIAATTGNDESILIRLDARQGTVLGATTPRPSTAIAGLTIVGEMAIVAEAPLGDIVAYDLTQPDPARVLLVSGAQTSGQPAGMTLGPDGTLLVASADEPVIQEFDLDTGVELDRFRIGADGLGGLRGIVFDPTTDHYLVTAGGDAVYELDASGALLDVHVHTGLAGAASITIVMK